MVGSALGSAAKGALMFLIRRLRPRKQRPGLLYSGFAAELKKPAATASRPVRTTLPLRNGPVGVPAISR